MSNKTAKKTGPSFCFIDVLSASIAIINAKGEIIAVNDAWRKFAIENYLPDYSNACLGNNYLQTCQKSLLKLNDKEAERAINGIQDVISGDRETFTMVYPCHSPTIHRWFRMEVGMADPDGSFFLIAHQDITDLRLAQDNLRKSEEKFSKAFHSAPVLMTISTIEEGRCLDLNDAFSRITGFDRKQAIGATSTELGLLKNEDRRQILQKLHHDGSIRDLELEATRADGSILFCHYSAVPIDVAGKKHLLSIASDITDRKMAEMALRESERNFRMLADNITDVIWSMDMDLQYTYISPSVEKLRGYTPEQAIQMPLEKTFTPESYQKVIHLFSEELAREGEPGVDPGRSIFIELDTMRKDGSIVPIEVNATFIRSDTGAPTGIIGTTRDITKRKQAETALKESEERFKALHNASFGGIVIHDKGLILECNKGLSEITGYAYQELIGMDGLALISDDTREKVIHNIDTGYEKPYEVKGVRKNGEIYPVRLEARTIPYKGKNVRVVEFRDLTETKRVEKEKENLESQLLQAQKMEAVGKLAGGVAHDFNNMLSVIIGHAGLAMDEMDPTHPLYARLKQIKNAGERSAELTRQLLAFARKQTISPKVLNINKAVESMIKMLHRLIGEDIDLGWKPGNDIWPVQVDPSQIDQILANLCVNARDAIADVGEIIIATGNVTLDESYGVDHADFLPGDYVVLSVSDDGCGMDAETQERIFEPFFTTKKPGKGTGLGLATVYGVVKQNNGFIDVHTEPERGCSIEIYFHRHLSGPVTLEEKNRVQTDNHGHETILLVEDEPAILEITTMMLEEMGYTVVGAKTPGEAIRLAQTYAGKIHLLLTDVVMPEMNGRNLAKNATAFCPDLKCLFMSGYTADVIAHHGVLDEGVNFIQKPFSKQNLSMKIRDVLDGS